MTGEFHDSGQIVITLDLRNEMGHEEQVQGVVDTGFGGYLMLTTQTVRSLLLPQLDVATAILADGSVVRLAVYEVIVVWNGEERTVTAYAGDGETLLGISMLRDHIGTFEFFPGGISTIEPAE